MPILSSDIGSLPPRIELNIIQSGAEKADGLLHLLKINNSEYEVFRDEIVNSQVDKLAAGLDLPNYPQFRDMNTMFLKLMNGYQRTREGLQRIGKIEHNGKSIPETKVIKQESKTIAEKSILDDFKVKICVTGPYTLASFFKNRVPSIIEELGQALASILQESLFKNRYAKVVHVCIDEPLLGLMNDHMLDYGQEGREVLRESWEKICQIAQKRGSSTSIHLHDTSENLFWETKHLDVIGSHINDPLYSSETTKKKLEETGKRLWAPIATTQFDSLITGYYYKKGIRQGFPELIADAWNKIRSGQIDPEIFIESREIMKNHLLKVVNFFGEENIAYASPECGLSSFPEYKYGIMCLQRASEVTRSHV